MSTKNLARSFVERGKYGEWKELEKISNRKRRRTNREVLKKIRYDSEFYDEALFDNGDKMSRYRKSDHRDNALGRWLYSHVGESWDRVLKKLSRRFKSKHGRDYQLRYRAEALIRFPYPFWPFGFYIDEDGILQLRGGLW